MKAVENITGYTPGPWICGGPYVLDPGRDDTRLDFAISASRSRRLTDIATTRGMRGATNAERMANARLIADAPMMAAELDRLRAVNADLLAALERYLADDVHDGPDQEPCGLVVQARAAIKRATGQ